MIKKIIIAVVIIIALVFVCLFPISQGQFDDGGTCEYTTLIYKVVKWNKITGEYDEATGTGSSYTYKKTSVYWFPHNFKSICELWKMEHKAG